MTSEPKRIVTKPERGVFIVIEGIDGSGTTTQTQTLQKRMTQLGIAAVATQQPSSGPIGRLLRQIMRQPRTDSAPSSIHMPQDAQSSLDVTPLWSTMSLLFVADRMDHVQRYIQPQLQSGVSVICDRYDYSTLTYQSISAAESGVPLSTSIPWLQSLNTLAPRPDITVILDVPPNIAAERRAARGGEPQMYEDDAMQYKLTEAYQKVSQFFPRDVIIRVDGSGTVDGVAEQIWQGIQSQPALRGIHDD